MVPLVGVGVSPITPRVKVEYVVVGVGVLVLILIPELVGVLDALGELVLIIILEFVGVTLAPGQNLSFSHILLQAARSSMFNRLLHRSLHWVQSSSLHARASSQNWKQVCLVEMSSIASQPFQHCEQFI